MAENIDIEIKNIETTEYQVSYDDDTKIIVCKGALRLNGMEGYQSIINFLGKVADKKPPKIYFNMKELNFLNSSGINVLSKFVIQVRQKKTVEMVLQGNKKIPWQGKSLKNLQRLMPRLELEWE